MQSRRSRRLSRAPQTRAWDHVIDGPCPILGRGAAALNPNRADLDLEAVAFENHTGLSHIRQCGDDVLRMLVTGGPPVRGGGGMPQRIVTISVPASVLRITGAG
jgi:hypothetical protein